MPHIDAYNMVSFDTESCHRQGGLTFSIYGAMDGYALIVDHRSTPATGLDTALRPLVRGRLVLGSGISKQDSKLLLGIQCKLGDTQTLSKAIQLHPAYPYQAPNYALGQKTGLKLVPEMLFGHCYGPLSLVTRKGTDDEDGDYQERQGFPQPFEWPAWLYPSKMYTFKTSPPSQEQIAYMYNDAVAPFLHVMLMTMLKLTDGSLTKVQTVPEALSLTASCFFGDAQPADQEPIASAPVKTTSTIRSGTGVSGGSPDLWSALGGIPPGASDEAILEALMYLPDDILTKIQGFQHLDTEDPDDADFIELYGGLFTLARASNVIEDRGLLDGIHDKVIKPRKDSDRSASDEAYASDSNATPRKRKTITATVMTDTEDLDASATTADTACQTDPGADVRAVGTQAASPSIKRRKIEVEVSTENGRLVAHIPLNAALQQLQQEEIAPGPLDDVAERHASEDNPETMTSESSEDVVIPTKPQDLPVTDRLRLLAGHLTNVDVPNMTTIPSRFGSSPDFEPRCHQCGHKQDYTKPHRVHPVDACPVLRKYGQEAFNPVSNLWTALPCLYPMCGRPAHHFTKLCPELHSLCLRCGLRGHSASRCDLVTLEYPKGALRDAYEVFAPFGLRSRKKATCADWEFTPTIPAFRVITHQDKHYLLPWSKEVAAEKAKLGPSEFKAELLQELYK